MDELSKAISWAFENKKIDVITMMNCSLQFFDTGYSLSSVARYLVAPETFMFFDEYNYKSIFGKLSEDPLISPKKLSKYIVESLRIKSRDLAIFAIRLKSYIKIGEMINELAKRFVDELPQAKTLIKNARDKSDYIDPEFSVIDFFYFLESLKSEYPMHYKNYLIEKLLLVKEKIILEQFIGEDFKNETGPTRQSPQGFSIYFPHEKSRLTTCISREFFNENSCQATLFVRVARWENFIFKYLTC
jgi:hypothetical protein